jgi:hypothetical protein
LEVLVTEPSESRLDTKRLILVPALVTLAVTVARVAGELAHGSHRFFNPEPGGAWAIVGIVWLAPIFGIYFALKLHAGAQGPKSYGRALGFVALGIAAVVGLSFVGARLLRPYAFRERLVFAWGIFVVAAILTLPGWPTLFRTLLAYSYAARVPVAIVMFFAFWRKWGTHYDAIPADLPGGLGLLPKFLWLGFFPQLLFWVAFTILVGMVCGSVAGGIADLVRRRPTSS